MERGWEKKVLDHGFVRFVDSLGTDESIIEAARMSTGKGFVDWEAVKECTRCGLRFAEEQPVFGYDCSDGYGKEHDWKKLPGDKKLLEYLYKMGHTTPFEMCELIVDIQIPMDIWRQMIRHRMASVNEYSTRYTEAIDIMAKTAPDAWRTQGVTNRQGSGAFLPAGEPLGAAVEFHESAALRSAKESSPGAYLSFREEEFHQAARDLYEERLVAGVAKEQARKDLPLSNYTRARWKLDLHNLLHTFLAKRMHHHAQFEMRSYANVIGEIAKAIWPRSFALFEEYTLHGVHLSRTEAEALKSAHVFSMLLQGGLDEKAAKSLVAKLSA